MAKAKSKTTTKKVAKKRAGVVVPPVTHYASAGLTAGTSLLDAPTRLYEQHGRELKDQPTRWQGGKVVKVLNELWPGGIPTKDQLSNTDLVFSVQAKMKAGGKRHVPHGDTILREAGRLQRKRK